VNPLQRLFVGLIRLYQIALSPYFGQQCRFTPTCSEYTRQAIQRHGAWKGAWLGMKRVSRCHPWHPGGHDPVP
jgi:putative membrane protein insertion efficiency factor